ncbi:FAD-dependent monooxygenase [Chitinophaga sp. 212800008-4]|uniref:FAD-dependent monooxygenase n=1 Tax=unclassified Chitinophaga TaxID=2619133 RepID=UPI0030D081B9
MNASTTPMQVPVLIAGGGVAGLSAALFLLQQGITPLLIERRRGTSIHPRARGFDIRTMELYRGIGLHESIREAGKTLAPAWGIHSGESLAAAIPKKLKKKKHNPQQLFGVKSLGAMSPEAGARCTQDLSEPVLLAAAQQRGADIHFNTELIAFQQHPDYVQATLRHRDTGEVMEVKASYMIAADGARSFVRETLQAPVSGKGPQGHLLNIYFEAPLGDFVRGREFSIMLIRRPGIRGMLTAINNSDRWVFHLSYDPAQADQYTIPHVTSILQSMIGLPDIPVRVLSILPWQPTTRVVNEMQHGRIFIAGDAAHTMTPYGGKGANSGIQDVHNLAWKLAAVLRGEATPILLTSYSPERQPVGLQAALFSGSRADEYGLLSMKKMNMTGMITNIMRIKLAEGMGMQKTVNRLIMKQLAGLAGLPDYRYQSAAIISNGNHSQISLNGQPGTRLPHAWIRQGQEKISTLDLAGTRFFLLTGSDNESWKHAAAEAPIALDIHAIDLIDTTKTVEALFGIASDGALLVRPDGFVAWQCMHFSDELNQVLKKILGFI